MAIFLELCIAAVASLLYVFVRLCRDGRSSCRCSCQVTGIRERLVLINRDKDQLEDAERQLAQR